MHLEWPPRSRSNSGNTGGKAQRARDGVLAPGGNGGGMELQTGKRYRCMKCGAEFIVTRGGEGTLSCGGDELEQL